jgi:2,3,4,5-tetrahydropyridine-2,6-dicarboxylate N-succinyltransferase
MLHWSYSLAEGKPVLTEKTLIEKAYENIETVAMKDLELAVQKTIANLNAGKLRVMVFEQGSWRPEIWLKKAILLYFRLQDSRVLREGVHTWFDKVPLKYTDYTAEDFFKDRVRVVPPATVRFGAYIGKNVVLMPSYVNIGAYVDDGTMIDTWATVGSGAQIGKRVHISGGVGIGGVLEPLQALPTVIEDDCFIGARSEIVEGVVVEQGSVIAMGVYLSKSSKIYDLENDAILYGRVPAGSVVLPGSLPYKNGKCSVQCAVIAKRVDQLTRSKTDINTILREARGLLQEA